MKFSQIKQNLIDKYYSLEDKILYWVVQRCDHKYKGIFKQNANAKDQLISDNYDLEDKFDAMQDEINSSKGTND